MTYTINNKPVGETGFGLMGMTFREVVIPDEQAFAAMKKSLELGANFWNSAEFYGWVGRRTDNLDLLNRYFTKYPEDADKVVISVKGGANIEKRRADGSEESIRKSIETVLSRLDGKKYLDIFKCARIDRDVPIEETIAIIAEYVKAGKIGGIGLSEASAATIRRAHAVHPIVCVEMEFSLFTPDILTNGVAEACAELGITIVAYSPLGHGFLTGQIRSIDYFKENSFARELDRFQPGNFEKNLELVDEINKVAEKKGITAAQLALAWIKHQSGRNGLPVIIPIPGATKDTRVEENSTHVEVTDEEMATINAILSSKEVMGVRYVKGLMDTLCV